MLRRLIAAAAAAFLMMAPARADQASTVTPGSPLTMSGLASYLNNALLTVGSNFSGGTPPATFGGSAKQFQFWMDTSATPLNVLRVNDGTTWVSIGSLNSSTHAFSFPLSQPVNAQTGTSYAASNADCGKLLTFNNAGAVAVSLGQPGAGGSFVDGCFIDTQNLGAGTVTFTPTLATIDGSATKAFVQNQGGRVFSDGHNYQLQRGFGTVFSVALSLPSIITVSGSPITASGTLTGTLATQSANTVWAGPTSGGVVAPTFRALVGADLPAPGASTFGGVRSLAATANNFLTGLGTDGIFTRAQPAASDLSNGVSGSGAVVLATGASTTNETLTTPAITGGTVNALTSFSVRSTASAFNLILFNDEVLTASRSIAFLTNDANRRVSLAGNLSFSGGFVTLGAFTTTVTATGTTAVTLPTAGTLATLAGTEALTGKTINGLTITTTTGTLTIASGKTFTASNSLTLAGTDGNTFTFPSGSDTVATLGATQTLTAKTLTSPAINAPTIAGGTHTALTSLGIRSTGAAFDPTLASSEVLTAGRTLSIVMGDAARTVSLGGNITTAAAFSTSGAFAQTLTATGATNVTLPTTGTLATLAGAEALTNKTVNGLTVTASSGTLTIANGKTLTASNSLGFTGTDGTSFAFPGSSDTVATLAAAQTLASKTLTAPIITGLENLQGAIRWSTESQPSQITVDQNDYNPGSVVCATSATLLINSNASRNITGLAGPVGGCLMAVINNGSFSITLKDSNVSSSAANRFGFGADLVLASKQGAMLKYDGVALLWRQIGGPSSSGGGSGTMTSLTCGNQTITTSGTCVTDNGLGITNCSLATSVASSALTIALKDASGTDPSSTSPCTLNFRSATAGTGSVTTVYVTAATSLVISSGSTMGSGSGGAFRLWVGGFNDAGTFRLAASNQANGVSQICPLAEWTPLSSTAEGGAGAADSACVIYTGTAVTTKAYRILGFVEFSSGQATAGTWATNADIVQLFGPAVPRPGQIIQSNFVPKLDTYTNTTAGSFVDITGMAASITPTSKANRIRISGILNAMTDTAGQAAVFALFRTSTSICGGTAAGSRTSAIADMFRQTDANSLLAIPLASCIDYPQSITSITYKISHILQGGTIYINRTQSDSDFNFIGRTSSSMTLEEIMG